MLMTRRGKQIGELIVLLFIVLILFACSDESSPGLSDGDMADGDATDGDSVDGDSVDGDATDGDGVDGDGVDGEEVDGEEELTPEEGERPLARAVTTLSQVAEPVWLVPGALDERLGMVMDDDGAEEPGAEIGSITNPLLTDLPNGRLVTATYGDVDNDGKQELIVLSLYTGGQGNGYRFDWPQITVIDDKDAGFATVGTIEKGDFDFSSLNPDVDSILRADMDVASIDDDDAAEIAVVVTYGRIALPQSGNSSFQHSSLIFTFDDLAHDLAQMNMNAETGDKTHDIRIALGDIDADDRAEIIVTGVDGGWAKAWALDDHVQGYTQLKRWHDLDDYLFEQYVYNPNVATGDFDGDGVDEIIFGGTKENSCRTQTLVFDDALHDLKYMENKRFEDCGSIQWNRTATPILETGDLDGDGRAEAVVGIHDNYAGQNRDWTLFWFKPSTDDSGLITRRASDSSWESAILDVHNPSHFSVMLADIDRDLKAEIYTLYTRTTVEGGNMPPYDVESETYAYVGKRYEIGDDGLRESKKWEWPLDAPYKGLVAPGDLDGDSLVVRYTGENWMAMSEPRIVVAMAMPPGWSDIPQANGTNTWVGYGQVREQSTSESNEIALSASVTMTVEGGDPFGIVSASASVSLKQELAKTNTHTKTMSTGVKRVGNWASDDLDDFVIYSTTEYTRYKYEVVSHEDASKIGTFLTVDVPKQTNTYKKTVSAFNEQNGDYPDIGPETFSHTIGDPESYASTEDRDEILENFTGWMTPGAGEALYTVGETSSGGTEVFISMTEENASAEARTMGIEASAGFSVGGVGVETSVGVSSTSIYEISVAESTEYAGSVGDIPSSHYADHAYTFGMFVYNFEREDGVKYQIIDWCVAR